MDLEQRWVLLAAAGGTRHTGDVVALAQTVLTGLFDRDVGIVPVREITVHAQEPVALVAQVEITAHCDGLGTDRLEGFPRLDLVSIVTLRSHLVATSALATTTTSVTTAAVSVESLLAFAIVTVVALAEVTALLTVTVATISAFAAFAAFAAISAILSATLLTCPLLATRRRGRSVEGSFVFGKFDFPFGQRFAVGTEDHAILLRGSWGIRRTVTIARGLTVAWRLLASRRTWSLLRRLGSGGLFENLLDQLGLLGAGHRLHAERLGDCHELLTVLRLENGLL
jgi:hypothetical protein